MYKLRILPGFQLELDEAVDHLMSVSPSAALALVDELERCFDRVTTFPFSMQPYPLAHRHADTYHCIDVKNYLAFYVVLEDFVEFRRFLPARADLPRRLSN